MRGSKEKIAAHCLALLGFGTATRTVTETVTTGTCPSLSASGGSGSLGGGVGSQYTTTDYCGDTVSGYVSQYTTIDPSGGTVMGLTSIPYTSGCDHVIITTTDSSGHTTIITSTPTGDDVISDGIPMASTADFSGLPSLSSSTATSGSGGVTGAILLTSTTAPNTSATAVASTGSSSSLPALPSSSPSSSGVATSASAAPPTRPSAPCPAALGTVRNSGGQQFQVFCETDFYYSDLQSVATTTFSDCLLACTQYQPPDIGDSFGPPCVAVTWTLDSPFGYNCYLKSAVATVQYGASTYISAKLATYNPPAGSVSLLPPPVGGAASPTMALSSMMGGLTSALAATTATLATTSSAAVAVSTVDVSPLPLTSSGSDTAVSPAASTPTDGTGTSTSLADSAPSSAAGGSLVAVCPLADGQQYALGSASFNISCDVAFTGDDLSSAPIDSLTECMQDCLSYTATSSGANADVPCVAVTFDPSNADGNTCSLHGPLYSTGPVTGVGSALIIANSPGSPVARLSGAGGTDAAIDTAEGPMPKPRS